jgi:hypothetical protein
MEHVSEPAVRLVIPAEAVISLNHSATATARIPVSDTGTLPLRVSASVADYTRRAQEFPGASWVTGISPSSLVIQPGQTAYFNLRIHVPPGAAGDHYTNLIARAAPAGSHGGASLSLAVGGTLRLAAPGHAVALVPHGLKPAYRPPAAAGGPPWLLLGAALAVAALAAAGALLGLRRRARRRADATAIIARHAAEARHAGSRSTRIRSYTRTH